MITITLLGNGLVERKEDAKGLNKRLLGEVPGDLWESPAPAAVSPFKINKLTNKTLKCFSTVQKR